VCEKKGDGHDFMHIFYLDPSTIFRSYPGGIGSAFNRASISQGADSGIYTLLQQSADPFFDRFFCQIFPVDIFFTPAKWLVNRLIKSFQVS
jgi:hypothetical protein